MVSGLDYGRTRAFGRCGVDPAANPCVGHLPSASPPLCVASAEPERRSPRRSRHAPQSTIHRRRGCSCESRAARTRLRCRRTTRRKIWCAGFVRAPVWSSQARSLVCPDRKDTVAHKRRFFVRNRARLSVPLSSRLTRTHEARVNKFPANVDALFIFTQRCDATAQIFLHRGNAGEEAEDIVNSSYNSLAIPCET